MYAKLNGINKAEVVLLGDNAFAADNVFMTAANSISNSLPHRSKTFPLHD
jgi:hypothetical protein